MSLIPADNAVAAVAGLFVIAAAGFLMEKTRIGALLTGGRMVLAAPTVLAGLTVLVEPADGAAVAIAAPEARAEPAAPVVQGAAAKTPTMARPPSLSP